MNATNDLRRPLLAALAFFDLFDYPLTLAELRRCRYGGSDAPLSACAEALGAAGAEERDGYFFLPGRRAIVETRKRRYRLAEKKFAKAARAARFLRVLPSVRLVAVCNSLAFSNADDESDIDLFVVTAAKTAWATRFLVVGALKLFGLRPDAGSRADKLCMSFFLSEDALDIGRLALPGGDTYLHYWIAGLYPIYDAGGIMEKFFAANSWIRRRLPAATPVRVSPLRLVPPAPRASRAFLAPLRAFEPAAKRLQRAGFPEKIRAMANLDSRVVITDDILKFHVNDRRADFEKRFQERSKDLA